MAVFDWVGVQSLPSFVAMAWGARKASLLGMSEKGRSRSGEVKITFLLIGRTEDMNMLIGELDLSPGIICTSFRHSATKVTFTDPGQILQ